MDKCQSAFIFVDNPKKSLVFDNIDLAVCADFIERILMARQFIDKSFSTHLWNCEERLGETAFGKGFQC